MNWILATSWALLCRKFLKSNADFVYRVNHRKLLTQVFSALMKKQKNALRPIIIYFWETYLIHTIILKLQLSKQGGLDLQKSYMDKGIFCNTLFWLIFFHISFQCHHWRWQVFEKIKFNSLDYQICIPTYSKFNSYVCVSDFWNGLHQPTCSSRNIADNCFLPLWSMTGIIRKHWCLSVNGLTNKNLFEKSFVNGQAIQ